MNIFEGEIMKYIFTVAFLIVVCACFAVSEYSAVFLGFEPSNINRAWGYGPSGVVDIWHNDPSASYLNPALAAMHEGISYSWTHESWLGYDMFYDTGIVNIGYKGFGFIFCSRHFKL
jgi:hypothetical protein